MADLGTISILVDVQGRPVINTLANDLNQVVVAEQKVSNATKEVINNFRSLRAMQDMAKKSTDDLSNSFSRLSNKDLQNASNALANYESTLANSRRGMGKFGVVTQQAGYQVGDFLVQIQSGTNPLVAFGQQATQLVGILPMMTGFLGLSTGALVALSAGLGIAIPLVTAIGAVFMRTSEESDAAAESIKAQKDAYDSLVQVIVRLREERAMLESGAATSEEQAVLTEITRLEGERLGLMLESAEIAARINEEGAASLGAESVRIAAALEANAAKRAELENLLRIADEERKRLAAAEAQRQAHADQVRYMGQSQNAQRLMTIAATEALDKYSKMRTVAAGLANELARGANEAFRLAQQNIAASGKTYSGRGGDPRTSNQQGYGNFVYTGPALDANNNVIPTVGDGGGRAEARLKKQIDLTKELTQVERERQTVIRSVEGSLEDGFMTMVEGTESVKDAFKKMAYEVIKELYRVLVVQRLVGGISSGVGMLFGKSTGSFGLPFGRASGGSIMPGQSYLVGENGPELVIPRHSGTVVNANQTAGGSGGNGSVTVQNNITVTGSDAAMVRAEVAKMIPQITNATKAAVIDARLRGGQMKAAFS